MPWPGKISSSLPRMSRPALRRQPNPRIDTWTMRAFSATVRFGQSDSSWKTGRRPSALARASRMRALFLPATTSRPRSGTTPPFKTCIRVDLPAPLCPTTPTHSPGRSENRRRPGLGRRRRIFRYRRNRPERPRPPWSLINSRALRFGYFIFALIAATASACVYSWLATPPFGMFGNSFSKSSWVKAR